MADKLIETLLAQVDSDLLIEELRRRLGLSPGAVADNGQLLNGGKASISTTARELGPIATGVIRPDEFFRLSNSEAIRKYLMIMKRPQSPRAIVEGLKAGGVLSNAKSFYATVWTELKRARERGEIVNTPSGWGLAEWYPNRPKGGAETSKKPKKKRASGAKGTDRHAQPTRKKKSPTSQGAPQSSGGNDYRSFMAERRRAGMELQEIAKLWKARNSASAGDSVE